MSEKPKSFRAGLIAAVTTYTLWGLIPIYWPLLGRTSALEILAHRIIWSAFFGAIGVAILARHTWWKQIASWRTLATLTVASFVIATNWGLYIWAVNSGHVTEAALGYYINPLISILFAVFLFKERLAPMQWAAIGLATVAVVVLTVEYGRPPWIALALAGTFAVYGVLKKRLTIDPIVSMTAESAITTIPALIFLGWLATQGGGDLGRYGVGYSLLLMSSGIVTAVPLLLFAFAAQRIPLSLLGITQYIAPTLQFLLGVFYFNEAMTTGRWIGFVLVWIALLGIMAQAVISLRQSRRAAKAAAVAPGEASTDPEVSKLE